MREAHTDESKATDMLVHTHLRLLLTMRITMSATKMFPNSFGTPVALTREDFIARWIEPTHQFVYLLGQDGTLDKLNEFQNEVIRLAGIKWDNHK
jgi:hypothetical protein